ncbi:MAG: relaxase/mobilization nuclease domain-containing protein [Chitinophagaceae bacterium]|nr:relaxase/mobilization nuclease domain-containing protein [Chitinophagaceae bacterium]
MPITVNRALNYNEKKVEKGKAKCIGEGNMLLPVPCMNFYQKLDVFQSRNELNERARTKTIHISLNFDPSENHSTEKLNRIASAYMDRIGFGEQPYLIYQHLDAAHPHIHILSTTIRADGSRINTHNLGRNQSEIARKELEEIFALVPASKQEKVIEYMLRPIEILKAEYGYSETRQSIANIVTQVIDTYNFISLPAFNAALSQFNVIADEGKEEGIIRRNKGLQYRMLDAGGNKIGVPIKASALPGKPTLTSLECKFDRNRKNRPPVLTALKSTINTALAKKPRDIHHLKRQLSSDQVATILRKNESGLIYGITFIDQVNRSVINGSELGKPYSIAGLAKRLEQVTGKHNESFVHGLSAQPQDNIELDLLDSLLKPEWEQESTPHELKKRRKQQNDNHKS